MNVRIIETDEIVEIDLYAINYSQPELLGSEIAADFIFGANPDAFDYDDETGEWVGSREDVKWWQERVRQEQEFDDRRAALSTKYGDDVIDEILEEAIGEIEFNDYARFGIQALDEFEAAQNAEEDE